MSFGMGSSKKSSDVEKVAKLLPLRPTGDLSVQETQQVDEMARFDQETRQVLAEYDRVVSILHEAGSLRMKGESPVARGEASLWSRIEPQLGPAIRPRMSREQRTSNLFIPTSYLTAACLFLGVGLFVGENRSNFSAPAPQSAAVESVSATPIQSSAPWMSSTQGPSASGPSQIDPRLNQWLQSTESISMPNSGLIVARINRLIQLQLQLPTMNGVVVAHVQPGSLAHRAGLERGDCIMAVNREEVYAPQHLQKILARLESNGATSIHFDLIRRRAMLEKNLLLDSKTE